MPISEYAALTRIAERNQVYWREILFRAHYGACTGMLRLQEWLHGSQRAFAHGNGLMFAAGVRGLVEACADTYQAYAAVPPTLADSHVVVRKAIVGDLSDQIMLAPELESMLIHFSHARKLKRGEGPTLHSAATARECISVLSEASPDVVEVYSALCEYTHPAASSLRRFGGLGTQGNAMVFDPEARSLDLTELASLSEDAGKAALVLGVAPLAVTLKILNAFSFAPVTTPWAEKVDLDFSDMWRSLRTRLTNQDGPSIASDKQRKKIEADLDGHYLPFGASKRAKAQ